MDIRKIWNKNPLNRTNIVLSILSIILISFIIFLYNFIPNDCYTEEVYLFNQYNRDTFCDGCLLMNWTNIINKDGGCIHVGDLTINSSDTHTYYFANEFEFRDDLKDNDVINVRWCNIKDKGYYIRGIEHNPYYSLWNRIDVAFNGRSGKYD